MFLLYHIRSRILVIKFLYFLFNPHLFVFYLINLRDQFLPFTFPLQMVPFDLPLHAGILPRLLITIVGEPVPGGDRYSNLLP